MAPAPQDHLSPPGAAGYSSDTMAVGDGTWDRSRNTFLLPNLQGLNFDTMRYNGMGNRFAGLAQYHRIVLAHGIMAALVFLLLVPSSVMMARFYARQPGYAVVFHAQLQVLAGLMLLAVFILGYFAVGPSRSLSNPHHGIGVALFVLFALQLVGGRLVRRITKLRSLRVMVHQWSGRAIALLGIAQVALGLTLYGSPRYLFVLFALWMTLLLLVFFALSYRSAGRRELYMSGGRSEAGRTRITESEYFSADPKPDTGGGLKWLGPLAALFGWAALRGRRRERDRSRSRSRSRSRARSHSFSRSRGPDVVSSRRGSESYLGEKYSEVRPPRTEGGGHGGIMKMLGGAAAAMGAAKVVSGLTGRRQNRRDEEYSAVSTETPRRQRSGRGAPALSEFSSDYTEDFRRNLGDGTNTSLLPPSANPPPPSQGRDARRPTTPRPMYGRSPGGGERDESDYSSYVSPSRRPAESRSGGGGGFAQAILAGLGVGWFTKKMADRRAKRDEERLREEEEMRSGTQGSRYTGDGFPSPTRRNRPAFRRPGRDDVLSEVTESSIVSPPAAGGRPRSRHDITEPVSMPPMPPDPHYSQRPEARDSQVSPPRDSRRPERRDSSRRRRSGERAAAAAAARAEKIAAEQERNRGDGRRWPGSPQSQPLSVKLKVHDDRDRNVTLRRLTEEEAMATRGHGRRGESDVSSLSGGLEPAGGYGQRYRRDASQQGRAERAAERATERQAEDQLAPLSPPAPAQQQQRRGKDSAYYSGPTGTPGATSPAGPAFPSSLGSPESRMSASPSGPGLGPDSAADDRRRRRRQERRAAASTSSRPSGQDMYD